MTDEERRAGKFVHLRRAALISLFFAFATGLIGFGFGVAGLVDSFGGDFATASMSTMVSVEAVLILTCILGVVGVIRAAPNLVKISIGLMLICMLIFAGVAVFTHLKLINLKAKAGKALENFMHLYGSPLSLLHNGDQTLDEIQKENACCGSTSPFQWKETKFGKLPGSCCRITRECLAVHSQNLTFEASYSFLANRKIPNVPVLLHTRPCVDVITGLYQQAQTVIVACAGSSSVFVFVVFSIMAAFSYVSQRLTI